ncbi:BspA family leucine-rich repeat surface protein [Bernardetia sp. Wsw4-3y2]|uniref:BspA family leucine-rich repeat surface protein n=1 Tax=Bernardetia sp. Wsw4-3y2 TaxID=3127471 RepID=UPI0030D33C97
MRNLHCSLHSLFLCAVFFTLYLFSVDTAEAQAFRTTWVTDDGTITILTNSNSGAYNYDITWTNLTNTGVGNGSSTGQTRNYTISGLTNGDTYEIAITGVFPHFYMYNDTTHRAKLRTIEEWGNIEWKSLNSAFYGCSNLTYNAIDNPNLIGVSSMSSMFTSCTIFNGNIGSWNTETVTDMHWMFVDATSFNQDIGNWNTENVTNMNRMFYNCTNFNGNIGNWNTENVESMFEMFGKATSFNQDIGNWNTENVINMSAMFKGATSFNQNIGNWNTSNVISVNSMFEGATSFNQNIRNWNTSNVAGMYWTFRGATSFNQDISNWNTEDVTTMTGMFERATSFNQDIGNWNTSNVTSMSFMFRGATSFNQNIGNWNTENVTSMRFMFLNASSFNQNIGSWDISNVTDMKDMLTRSGLNTSNYDATLIGWVTQNVQPNVALDADNLTYCRATVARSILTSTPNNWVITGDTQSLAVSLNNITLSQNQYGLCINTQTTLETDGTGTVYWYDSPTNNIPIHTGSNFTTPVLTADSTYFYAQDSTVGCGISDRLEFLVTTSQSLQAMSKTNYAAYLDNTGSVEVNAALLDSISSAACGDTIVSYLFDDTGLSTRSFSCADTNAVNVVLRVTDNNGNTETSPTIIHVKDTIRPVISVRVLPVSFDASNQATISARDFIASLSDNCTDSVDINVVFDDTGLETKFFDCGNTSVESLNLRITDRAGNQTIQPVIINPSATSYDFNVNIISAPLRPAIISTITALVNNYSCAPKSGELKVTLPSDVTYVSSSITPNRTVGTNLFWDVTDLSFDRSFSVRIQVLPNDSLNIGDEVCFSGHVTPETNDLTRLNNLKQYCFPIVNSYDPNDKQVYPQGICDNKLTKRSDLPLTYTIRFQNTGNAPALKVNIVDSLSNLLDRSSLKIVESSHTMVVDTVANSNVITFRFDDINLPDSTSNLEGSQGYVIFELDEIAAHSDTSRIENKSYIYFDTNEPIITNTVKNTIVDALPTVTITINQENSFDKTITVSSSDSIVSVVWFKDGNEVASFNNQKTIEPTESGNYKAKVTYISGCEFETEEKAFTFDIETGIEEESAKIFTVYPNPNNGSFKVEFATTTNQKTNLVVVDALGRTIYSKEISMNQKTTTITLPKISAGVYVVQIVSQGKVYTKQLVIQ